MAAPSGKTWLIRVASGPQAGGGHVGRCTALAQALEEYGTAVLVLDRGGEHWMPRLKSEGLDAYIAGDEPTEGWSGSVMDGYGFDEDDARALALRASPLAVIDDFLRPPPSASLFVNPAPHLEGGALGGIPALLGASYALLKRPYWNLARRKNRETVRRVVVSMGYVDSRNTTGRVLEALAALPERHSMELTVVLGHQAPHRIAVERMLDELDMVGCLAIDLPDLSAAYCAADLAFGAGGVGLLERLACGVPSISVPISENQILPIRGATAAGATISVDRDSSIDQWLQAIRYLWFGPDVRAGLSKKAQSLVDGRGAARVAAAIDRQR